MKTTRQGKGWKCGGPPGARYWSPAEDAAIRAAMAKPKMEKRLLELAERLNRSYGAIRTRAWHLKRAAPR